MIFEMEKTELDGEVVNEIVRSLEETLKPYNDTYHVYTSLPSKGRDRDEILKEMQEMNEKEEELWSEGYVSGTVYYSDPEQIAFANKVYELFSQTNPLHPDVWPSMAKFESEIISMTADLMGRKEAIAKKKSTKISGTLSSGGTESIMLAMKTYRDKAAKKGIAEPEIIAPLSAHAAFDKSAQYFKMKLVHIPLGDDFRADVSALEKAINKNTAVIVGTAGTFPHGVIDPIEEMSAIAKKNKIPFHTDACLGGFFLPFARKLGRDVPHFDFRLPGVTSISIDTHKYGYTNKGTSVILYRTEKLRRLQYYSNTEWTGGIYFSPTFAGSRPGALSAIAWATMISIGEEGYLKATEAILKSADRIKEAIIEIPELRLFGDSHWNIAFGSDTLNAYEIMAIMGKKKWGLNGLQKPVCVHFCLTQRHSEPKVVDRFISDLKEAVEFVKNNPSMGGGKAAMYGLASTFPDRKMVKSFLDMFLDMYFK